jgi:uncharacterized membrane protein
MSRKALSVVVAAVAALLMVDCAAALPADWWDNSWHYRINVTVNTSIYNRTDWPIEVPINFTDLGLQDIFDNNSVRVIQYNGTNVSGEITSQFDRGEYYDNATNAYGEVVWLLNGTIPENTILEYFIYFDSVNFGTKAAPTYDSFLEFESESASTFGLNNSKIAVRMHTDAANGAVGNRNHTSGMYFAQFNESGDIIFNVNSPTAPPIEYIRYCDDSPCTEFYNYNFTNNFVVENIGPVRITIKQQGDEVEWGVDPINPTTGGNMTKRYTLYRDNQWLKIKQEFTSSIAQKRLSAGWEALSFDMDRASIAPDTVDWDSTDPYAHISIYEDTGGGMGMGIINIDETEPVAGAADYGVANFVGTKMGLNLISTADIPAGASISETAVVYFNNETSHDPVINLKNRFEYGANIAVGSKLERTVALVPNTTFEIYNRNETILITGNITSDDYNLSYSANATLTSPSLVNRSVNLTRNGTIYEGNYTISTDDEIGVWTLTTRTYDDNEYLLNTTQKTFNVTDIYIVEIKLLNPIGLVNLSMWANISVKTYRNDTGIPGIAWPNLTCAFYNATDGSQITDVTSSNISEAPTGFGNYTANWSAPGEGFWNISCNASSSNNTGTANGTFLTTVKNTTALIVTLDTSVQWNAPPYNASFVKWNENQTFVARVNVTNIELGLAQDVNVTFNFTGAGWWVSNISNPYPLGDLLPLETRIIDFEITIPNRTNPTSWSGFYNVTANATWENFIGTKNETSDWFNVTVDSNSVLEIIHHLVNLTAWENSTGEVNFTVFAAGNVDLGLVNYSCTSNANTSAVCGNFTPAFNPVIIGAQTRGDETNVTVNFTIPDGQVPGSYYGNITVNHSNQIINVTMNVTVPASRNWTMNRSACFEAALPNQTGDVCELEINNTGNVDLNFTVTPAYGYLNAPNYTYSNETNFTVPSNTSRIILFRYNTTTTTTNHTNITVFTINSTDPFASPDDGNLTVTLDVVFGPDLYDFNITPALLSQLDNLTIDATITDRLLAGNNASDIWVSANITWANGTLIETVNLTNITPLSPGATSNWSLNYSNTRYRGFNFSVTIFSQDRRGGYAEITQEKNFTVYAKLSLVVSPTRPSNRYDPGDNFYVRVFANDSNFEPLDDVNFTIYLMDASDNNATTFYLLTSGGTAVTQTAYNIYEGVIGDWKLVAYASYYDTVVDRNISVNVTTLFKVDYAKELSVQTDSTHYRGTSFPVRVFVTQQGSLVNVSGNVSVSLSFNGATIQTVNATLLGDYYESTMNLSAGASDGAYLAKVTAYDGGTEYSGFVPFNVPATSAASLTLDISVGSAYEPGDVVPITAFLSDQDSMYINDSTINLTITDPNNNATALSMTAIPTTSPPKYTANYTIPNNAILGPYTLFGNVSYGGVYTSDVKVFVVTDTLFTQIAVDPIVYINESMNITMTIINPITSQGIDPDEMTLTLYNTSNGIIEVWKTLTKSDFTNGTSLGVFTYGEIVPNGTANGTYSAILEVTEGSYRVWGMETFRITPRVVADIFVINVVPTSTRLDFDLNITNMGDYYPNDDYIIDFEIDGGAESKKGSRVKIKAKGVSDVIPFYFDNIDLTDGDHTLTVVVSYPVGNIIADIDETFTVGDDAGPGPGPGPGGGGGGPKKKAEPGIAKISIVEFYPSEVHVERGGITYLVASVENLGGTTLTDISAEVSGIPEEWYELIKGEVEVLESGNSSDVLIQIKIPQNVSAQLTTLTVKASSTETSYEKSLIMRIFSSREDLVYFEIESVKKTMRNSEDRSLRALNEGKNVSEVMKKIDEARMEIRQAENFLSQSEYENALGHLDSAREVLEHVNELMEFLRSDEVPVAPVATPAPGLGVSTPILLFMVFVIVVLAGMVAFLARDQITGVFGNITTAPTVKKARAKRASPEALSQANNLRAEITNTERLLGTMKGQHEAGLISDSTYKELKNRNDDKIKTAKERLKKLGV